MCPTYGDGIVRESIVKIHMNSSKYTLTLKYIVTFTQFFDNTQNEINNIFVRYFSHSKYSV